jgi:hypothetical protein
MQVFNQGKTLSPGDLGIATRDAGGQLVDPTGISYTIFSVDDQGTSMLASAPKLQPARSTTGVYYVTGVVPTAWIGKLKLVWYLQQYAGDAEVQIYEEFEVVRINPATTSFEASSMLIAARPGLTPTLAKMVVMVRELLSDTDPDRNYHFSPPTSGKVVANFNSRVGFLWLDSTIIVMLEVAISILNTQNPMNLTSYTIYNIPTDWWKIATLGAASLCLSSKASVWTEEEFGYSLNGVSLDINKAGNYMNLAAAYKTAFDAAAPNLTANRPACAGLRQQRWLLG